MKMSEFKEQQPVITGGRFIATLIIILFLIVFSLALVSYCGDHSAVNNCQIIVKEEKARCDEYFKKFVNEVDKGRNQLITEQYNRFAELKDNYKNWSDMKTAELSNCTHSLNECQKQLKEQGEAAIQKALELLNAEKLHQVEMKFKDSQLKECYSRLNKTIEVLRSKGIEHI